MPTVVVILALIREDTGPVRAPYLDMAALPTGSAQYDQMLREPITWHSYASVINGDTPLRE